MKKVLILLLFFFIYLLFEISTLAINSVEIKTEKINGEVKILQISDYHDSKFHSKFIINAIRRSKPDIIVITGDLIDQSTKSIDRVMNLIDEIVAINKKIYYVPGNHEYYSGLKIKLLGELQKRGVIVLINKNTKISVGMENINLCGIDDFLTGNYDIKSALFNIDKNNFTILLSHSPDVIIKNRNIDVDLILSGHTHGGQIRLPLIGALVAPGQGFLPEYDKGLFKINNTLLYIDSGVGTSHYPIRFLNRSQISLIRICNKDK
ncbi:putative metallophosphoesterase [Caloramator mitchellensis]|uniref:Putative metallophosphoesterase n=1 Tax=Caloramator mitchellensis TaxID=908809 RepID=A0A0R3JSB0_CALMK|nr:metallophosphoesterase [Caloramator mitchellensis]KRQ86390.1 putative metallophosphoesterase [Caloramator mitchellensis]